MRFRDFIGKKKKEKDDNIDGLKVGDKYKVISNNAIKDYEAPGVDVVFKKGNVLTIGEIQKGKPYTTVYFDSKDIGGFDNMGYPWIPELTKHLQRI